MGSLGSLGSRMLQGDWRVFNVCGGGGGKGLGFHELCSGIRFCRFGLEGSRVQAC